VSLPKKRSKSLSLSDVLIRKLSHLWYEEVKTRLNRDERLSFSEFVEQLLWESVKKKTEKPSISA